MNKAKIAILYFSFIFYLFLIFPNNSFSQTDSSHFKRWSVGIFGGYMLPTQYAPFESSPNLSVEIAYNINQNFALYFNGIYNFLKTKSINPFIQDGIPKETPIFNEMMFGIKSYFSKTLPRFFGEASIEYYRINFQFENQIWEVVSAKFDNFGFNTGIGFDFNTFKNITVSTKFKYSYLFTDQNWNDPITYFGFYSGLKYMF